MAEERRKETREAAMGGGTHCPDFGLHEAGREPNQCWRCDAPLKPQEECPERLEDGPHRWEPGAPGTPDWCYYCEKDREPWSDKEEAPPERCVVCGKALPGDEPGVCPECFAANVHHVAEQAIFGWGYPECEYGETFPESEKTCGLFEAFVEEFSRLGAES